MGPMTSPAHHDLAELVEDIYELSPLQEGMLLDSVSADDSGLYLIQLRYRLRGDLDVPALERAAQSLVARHAILRTTFHWEGIERPVQVVRRELPPGFKVLDWRELPATEIESRLAEELLGERRRGVDFEHGPLVRWKIVRTAPRTFELIWSFHHVLIEGWSASILLRELLRFYAAERSGRPLELEPPRPYKEYVLWLQAQDPAALEGYWREKLAGFEAPTPLGTDGPAEGLYAPVSEYAGKRLELPRATTATLEATARRLRITLNTLVQGAWAILLSRYSGENDVVFGNIVSGRSAPLPGIRSIVGLFVNLLPARVRTRPDETAADWLKALQNDQASARRYEHTPLVRIKGWSDLPPGVPLFESIVIFENWLGDVTTGDFGDEALELDTVSGQQGGPGYPLALVVVPGARLSLALSYDRDRFDDGAIRRRLEHLRNLLVDMAADPGRSLGELRLLDGAERHRLLVQWNRTRHDFPTGICAHHLFEARAAQTPDAVAVVCGAARLEYGELNARSNRLAHRLIARGVGPDVPVGICAERSLDMIVAVLAVLKAGGAYVALDPTYPRNRLAYMLEGLDAPVLLAQEALVERLPETRAEVLRLDDEADGASAEGDARNPDRRLVTENLAYVVFTSGSTGRPKGVMVTHRSFVNAYRGWEIAYALKPGDRHLQMASFSFDVFSGDWIRALGSGARLVLCPYEVLLSGDDLCALIRTEEISIAEFVPAILRNLLEHLRAAGNRLDAMRMLVVGSDVWNASEYSEIRRHLGNDTPIVNSYGVAECTIDSTFFAATAPQLGAGGTVPIGRPFANIRIYMLDPRGEPVPVGVPGELVVGGEGLARGYLGDAALSADRFEPDPFGGAAGSRLYRTGDLARWRPNGDVDFLGRADTQVKVRGFRIELAEIESVLARHRQVREVAVLARDARATERVLVAYLVTEGDPAPSSTALREYLGRRLPDHMVPQAFVTLDAFPLTPAGKVDRKALPAPEPSRPDLAASFVAPRTPVERTLASLWTDVLGIEEVGVHDNFFDLGGHSLVAIRLIGSLRQVFTLDIPVRRLFECPTIAELAPALVELETSAGQVAKIADLYQRVEGMSNAEVGEELGRRQGSGELAVGGTR